MSTPDDAQPLLERGKQLTEQGDHERARELLMQALELRRVSDGSYQLSHIPLLR